MINDRYSVSISSNDNTYEFISIGAKGEVKKIIKFAETFEENVFALGFGDVDKDGHPNDSIRTNNGDIEKVLTTVAYCCYMFSEKNPDAKILFQGSTNSRTRLYRVGISKYLDVLLKDFVIYGHNPKEDVFELYQKNKHYDAFLVTKRKYVD